MKTGEQLFNMALSRAGAPYVFGVVAPKNDPNWKVKGFDCAELASWTVFQVGGILYGTNIHDLSKAKTADAYTGYWQTDAKKMGKIISVEEGIRTKGAFLLRFGSKSNIGHIVCSGGDGSTAEANSIKYGCGKFSTKNRRFDIGVLVPGFDYGIPNKVIDLSDQKPKGIVYKFTDPLMPKSDKVKEIQNALINAGYYVGKNGADGYFGESTELAAYKYQIDKGLNADGEVYTEMANSLNIKL